MVTYASYKQEQIKTISKKENKNPAKEKNHIIDVYFGVKKDI